MAMEFSRFIDYELAPGRRAVIQAMIDSLDTNAMSNGANFRRAAPRHIRMIVAHVSLHPTTPQNRDQIADGIDDQTIGVYHGMRVLTEAGFLAVERRKIAREGKPFAKPAAYVTPQDALYEGISIMPDWQAAVNQYVLAEHMGVSPNDVAALAINAQCVALDLPHLNGQ